MITVEFTKKLKEFCIKPAAAFFPGASLWAVISLSAAWAQAGYPAKALRLVVPYPPGASTDMFGRIVAQKLAESFGHPVVVENRGGANGAIGAENVAKAVPDGYSLLINTSSYTTNAAVQRKLSFDPVNDLAAVGMIAKGPLVIVVNPAVPAHSVNELIGLARARPDALSYCSAGNGSIQQFATEMFLNATKTTMVHVPYKGMAPAVADLMGGHVQVLFASIPTALSQVKAQRLRALAVTSQERTSVAPEIPTVREGGVPGYSVELWWGLFVTGKAPLEAVARLNAELRKALLLREFRDRIAGEGAEPAATTPVEFQKIVTDDILKWRSVVESRGIKAE
jgi:tripartite-type tricarboxylate transporter receptor subunit TctC